MDRKGPRRGLRVRDLIRWTYWYPVGVLLSDPLSLRLAFLYKSKETNISILGARGAALLDGAVATGG